MPALRALGLTLVRDGERTATSSKTTFLHFTRVVAEPAAETDNPNVVTSPTTNDANMVTPDTAPPMSNGVNGVSGFGYAMGADDPESPLFNV